MMDGWIFCTCVSKAIIDKQTIGNIDSIISLFLFYIPIFSQTKEKWLI
jgi:hypothetical protein